MTYLCSMLDFMAMAECVIYSLKPWVLGILKWCVPPQKCQIRHFCNVQWQIWTLINQIIIYAKFLDLAWRWSDQCITMSCGCSILQTLLATRNWCCLFLLSMSLMADHMQETSSQCRHASWILLRLFCSMFLGYEFLINLCLQEFMILPVGASSFKEAMKMGVEVYHHLKVDYNLFFWVSLFHFFWDGAWDWCVFG